MNRAASQPTSPGATALVVTSPASSFIFKMGNVAQMAKTVSFVRILNDILVLRTTENNTSRVIVEGTLNGGFSSVDISKIPPHSFNSALGFSYTNGAGGRSVRQHLILLYCRLMSPCHSVIHPNVSATTMVSTVSELQTDPADGILHSILQYGRLWRAGGQLRPQCGA
jgi:hypothetical protein